MNFVRQSFRDVQAFGSVFESGLNKLIVIEKFIKSMRQNIIRYRYNFVEESKNLLYGINYTERTILQKFS